MASSVCTALAALWLSEELCEDVSMFVKNLVKLMELFPKYEKHSSLYCHRALLFKFDILSLNDSFSIFFILFMNLS